jgi:hypothetical protein
MFGRGEFMRGIVWLALCGFLLTAGGAHAADCQLKMLGTIDLEVTQDPDQVLVPVTLGEQQKKFALDIGASFNAIDQESARQAGFRIRSLDPNITLYAMGQKVQRLGFSPKFKVGSLPGEGVEFAILPEQMSYNFVGILGMRLFERLDFELDIAQHKLNIFSPDHCPEKVVYWTKAGFAELPFRRDGAAIISQVLLDGKPLRATFSTFRNTSIGMNTVRQLFGLDENSPGMVLVRTAPDGEKFYRYPFKGLALESITVNNPNILIRGEAPVACSNRPKLQDTDAPQGHVTDKPMIEVTCFGSDITIGISVMSKLHAYYSAGEKIIYLTAAGDR